MKEFKPVFLPDQLARNFSIKQPSKVFISFMGDWAADWHSDKDRELMFQNIKCLPEQTFLLLTKQPQNLTKWSPFPNNCYVGVSVCDGNMFEDAIFNLSRIKARVEFLSFEPLLNWVMLVNWDFALSKPGINRLIIGRQTPPSKKTEPKIEWIREIVEAADKAGIPIFLKDNIYPKNKLGSFLPIEAPFFKQREDDKDVWDFRADFPKVDRPQGGLLHTSGNIGTKRIHCRWHPFQERKMIKNA